MCRSAKMLQCLQSNALVSFKVDSASTAYLDMVPQKISLSCLEGLFSSMRGSFTSECLPVGSTTRPCVHHQALQAASKRTLPLLQLPSIAPGGLPTTDLQHRVQPRVSYRPRSASCGGSLAVTQPHCCMFPLALVLLAPISDIGHATQAPLGHTSITTPQ
jgi:hypothetical protein